MRRLNLRIDALAMQTIWCVLLLAVSANGATYAVKAGGGGNYTTIQACATAMAAGDTCVVYAGTYSETPSVPAGTAGNYKTITVNGSDAVSVTSFTLGSHTKLLGNCAAPASMGTCGFSIGSTGGPTGVNCITLASSSTDIFVVGNALEACGSAAMIGVSGNGSATYVYIQNNTLSFACSNPSESTSTTSLTIGTGSQTLTVGTGLGFINGETVRLSSNQVSATNNMSGSITSYNSSTGQLVVNVSTTAGSGTFTTWWITPIVCNGMLFEAGDHYLIQGNDVSHCTLCIDFTTSYNIIRGNTFHDTYESEGAGNQHTDAIFSEAGITTPVQYNVYEGNYQYNGFGADAKGMLTQTDGCGGDCYNFIERYNVANRIGGAMVTNNSSAPAWPYLKAYNNTWVNTLADQSYSGSCSNPPIGDNSQYDQNAALLNSIYYYTNSGMGSVSCFNPYACGSDSEPCSYGHNLAFCTATCAGFNGTNGVFSHTYQSGSFTGDPGNIISDPLFVNPSNNFSLKSGSPAIAAGTYLTTVASGDSGSGTSLVVNDASYFQDGYGLSNAYSTVHPDCVSVTTVGSQVCVTAVNYSTNTLTLASSITRSPGNPVWLYSKSDGTVVLTGTAPDMGAYPYTGGNSGPVAPPTSVSAVTQ